MKPCEVEATFTLKGEPQPRQINWEGQVLGVQETGRRWSDEAGQHVLARVTDGRVFELVYSGGHWLGKVVNQPPNWA